MQFVLNDGGRSVEGFKGEAGDCVCRAIAIASELPYKSVYELLNETAKKHRHKGTVARTGVPKKIYHAVLKGLGWTWVPTMRVGQGCTTHLRQEELPNGRLIVQVSKHLTAVIDHVIHDTHAPSRSGTRCVYGYFHRNGS